MSRDATIDDVLRGDARWCVAQRDAVDLLHSLPTDSIDAVVTDPPYCSGSVSEASRSGAKGQGLRSETLTRFGWFVGDNMGTAGLVFLLRSIAFEARRAVRPSGHLLCFCDWRMVVNVAPALESGGWRYQNLVVWDKGSAGLGLGFRAQHELAVHLTAGSPASHDKGTGNVLRAGRIHSNDREHQTQKPIDLMQQLLRVVLPPNGTVLDPFGGSGSTGVAALRLGARAIVVERDPGHAETARERLEAEQEGLDLEAARAGQVALFGGGR